MLEEKLKGLPDKPGVYLFKDARGKIIYIGKAVDLKNRVRSYFTSQHADSPKTRVMVNKAADLEYIITDTEIEALILESNLIKKHKPQYNIRLTDDKHYPFLRVTVQEEYPRIELVRSSKKDGARYFGPYTSAAAVHETMKLLKRIFPTRSCRQSYLARKDRPCLNAHIGRCAAPCCGRITKEEYRKIIDGVILFLEGKRDDLIKSLKDRMEKTASLLEFEKAAEIRDQLQAVETVTARQKIISERLIDLDVINYAQNAGETCVEIFFVRNGRVWGRDHFFLDGTEDTKAGELLGAFIKQYYNRQEYIPSEILVPVSVDDEAALEDWLSAIRGSRVRLRVPKKGDKRSLLELVGKNAGESLRQEKGERAVREDRARQALQEMTRFLGLENEPSRIECYDISHIQGADTVASMAVFVNGKASPADYRRFKIKNVDGPDDYASMAEVIERRFAKAGTENGKFAQLPDLVVIDGGKGQLAAARQVMTKLGYGSIATVALAKEKEWVFTENNPDLLILPRDSEGLYLLQRIRDEAHRFAVTYHRLLRGKRSLSSALDEIAGIGPQRKKALLQHFGMSLKKISQAPLEELESVEGMTRDAARQVWEFFHPSDI